MAAQPAAYGNMEMRHDGDGFREQACAEIDVARHRYPYSIVWTPIHPITWIFPFVGHMGICDNDGNIHDWGGGLSNFNNMLFGNPTRYLQLRNPQARDVESGSAAQEWNEAIRRADAVFVDRIHCMVCGSDCHSHVCEALNTLRYGGCAYWQKVPLAAWVFFRARHTSIAGFVSTWLGTLVIVVMYLITRSATD